jgi:hypothetical protein
VYSARNTPCTSGFPSTQTLTESTRFRLEKNAFSPPLDFLQLMCYNKFVVIFIVSQTDYNCGCGILSQDRRFEKGPKKPSKGTPMKLLVFALNAQFGVYAGRKLSGADFSAAQGLRFKGQFSMACSESLFARRPVLVPDKALFAACRRHVPPVRIGIGEGPFCGFCAENPRCGVSLVFQRERLCAE